jgi:hypothetical protein
MLKLLSHIALSSLLLLSSTGLKINLHFCQDHLYDLAINTPAHDCCANGNNTCHHNQDQAHHCDDRTIQIKNTDNFLVSGFYPGFENNNSNDVFFVSKDQTDNSGIENVNYPRLLSFKKPPPGRDVFLSRIQSFII